MARSYHVVLGEAHRVQPLLLVVVLERVHRERADVEHHADDERRELRPRLRRAHVARREHHHPRGHEQHAEVLDRHEALPEDEDPADHRGDDARRAEQYLRRGA